MSNTISAILPSVYAGLNMVSRELIGLIPAVQTDATVERAAVGQSVTVPIVPQATGGNITPGSVPPDDGDQVIGSMSITISKSKYSPVRWNGEEQLALGPGGQYNKILADQFKESFRWLANQVEADGVAVATAAASRAYGTLNTTPFGTAGDFSDFAGANQLLDVNGAPQSGRHLVVGSAARFNLEAKQSILFKANEAGTDDLLRRRQLTEVMGFGMGYSAGVGLVAAGTGTGYLVNSAALAVGATSIPVDTGSGTIPAGTVFTIAGDTTKYVSHGVSGSNLLIGAPGLRVAPADNAAITLGAAYTPNIVFTEDALVLAARAPATPVINGVAKDSAEDRQMVVDPVSGLGFEVSLYNEYRRIRFEVALAWGWGAPNPAHIGILAG